MTKTVFLSGCGGGYDLFGALPYYFKIKAQGDCDITLINYTFTTRDLLTKYSRHLTTILYRVEPIQNTTWLTDEIYFPEQRLANEIQVPIYAILCNYQDTRIELIVEAYEYLIAKRTIDEIILFDCGCDVLLTGKEQRLGTPVEDMSHARAVQLLSSNEVKSKYIAVIGTNIDAGHGVIQSDIDDRLAALAPGAIFTWSLQYEHDEHVRRYVEIVSHCSPSHTIVHSLVCAALQGHRGYYLPDHLKSRIHKSVVPLTDETCVCTGYHFDDVMRDNVHLKRLEAHMNLKQVYNTIYNRNEISNDESSTKQILSSLKNNKSEKCVIM
ncbi:unnamed protein product [Adineta ricciae]|uniref:DUF1152 domain-containing protein n=1 Tax=Adineta ricciae TaxID=249248 RepID=A0A815YM63_ADIRI|nr:unnamed protein product [Adineta ricciae]